MDVSSSTIIIAIGIHLGFFSVALCLEGNNTCVVRTLRDEIIESCCADYEEVEDKCVVCRIGYTSHGGEPCRECSGDSYGVRCGKRCACSVVQRCDNILGCVDVSQPSFTTLTSHITPGHYSTTDSSTQGNRSDGNSGEHYSITDSSTQGNRSDENNGEHYSITDSSTQGNRSDENNGGNYSTTDLSTQGNRSDGNNGEDYSTTDSSTQGNRSDGNNGGVFSNQAMVYYIAGLIILLMAVGMCFLFAKYRKLHTSQRLFLRNGDSSNVNEQIQLNDDTYIYDEINDLDLDEFHEMHTSNNLNHDITSGASIIDIDESHDIDDIGYEMPFKSMNVDENINDIARNRPTLADDNSLKFDNDITETGYLNPYQPLAASFRLNTNERSSYGAYSNLYEPLKRNWKSLSFGYEIAPNKYIGDVCTSAKVSSTDRGIPMTFSVTTEQCSTGTAHSVLMMKRQLKCNSAPNLQMKL